MEINSWTITENLKRISHLESQEEQICSILPIFHELFGGDRLQFYRFSPIGYVAEGIALFEDGHLYLFNYIRDDLRTLPIIRQAVEKRKPIYYNGNDIITQTTSRYQRQDPLKALLVVPIIANNLTIAYINSEYIHHEIPSISKKLGDLELFGKLLGQLLIQPQIPFHSKLSPRENEIMKALANGLTTKEMTHILSLSEATIKQYIKSIMKKLEAKNRTHALSIYLSQYQSS